jgi:hypothetical protein
LHKALEYLFRNLSVKASYPRFLYEERFLLAMLLEEHKEVMKLRERVETLSTRLV